MTQRRVEDFLVVWRSGVRPHAQKLITPHAFCSRTCPLKVPFRLFSFESPASSLSADAGDACAHGEYFIGIGAEGPHCLEVVAGKNY